MYAVGANTRLTALVVHSLDETGRVSWKSIQAATATTICDTSTTVYPMQKQGKHGKQG
jgi:chemotaxis signal transduction protein